MGCLRGSGDLEQGALWDFAEVSVAPEGDGEFACEGDDADLAQSRAAVGEAVVEPEGELAVRLLA